ncbi:velvet factor [Fimicolochytrium jonesii]|uniref:velvet factor n=1 Tax=Fimicolochytrium jonesii TaxID=1396493 RepID=UPI0022FF0532|nr:velvet factor [Fimicolochytrium jonesii]KAI8822638.1 velvet factor [Fimicolochytrium jonesii]
MRDQDGVASKSTSKVDGKPEEKVPRAASYELRMLQHPARVRCCGYGNKDRRTIDPCPVLELVCLDATGAAIESVNEAPFLVCHASIWSEDGQEDSSLIENMHSHKQRSLDSSATQNLVGSLTNLSRPLRDVDNQKKLLFVFADLSVRLPGMFTLRFQLLDVSFGRHDEGVGSYMVGHSYMGGAPQLAMIQTKPFESYRPKLFPGMLQTTALSKKLAQQGVSEIRVRKDPVPRPS